MESKINYKRKSYTIADYYQYYLNQIERDTIYEVDYRTYKKVLTDYFIYLRDQIIEESKEVKLPCRLGTIQIIKHQPKEFTGKSLRWDWKATKETGQPVYLLNEHSGFFKYRYHWNKQNCLIKNKIKYQFIASRDNKRYLCQIIKNKVHDYIER